MAKKHYDEASCVRSLSRKSSIRFTQLGTDKCIQVLKNHTDVGNGSWGKIDYLRKVHGYLVSFVPYLEGNKKHFNNENELTNNINSKTVKRERKFNMASMTKSAMKKVRTK